MKEVQANDRDHNAPQDARWRQIVDAAYYLLEEQGLEGLTIRAVLARTGLARRAFYDRFVGKDDLVLAVFEQTIRSAAVHYDRQEARHSNPLERLEMVVTSLVLARGTLIDGTTITATRRAAAMSREHLRLAEARPEDLQAALEPLIALLTRTLSEGMEAGDVRRSDARRLAVLIYNLVSSTTHTELLTQAASPPGSVRRQHLADDIWEFCRRAITP